MLIIISNCAICSHGLVIRSLILDNSFSWIAIRSLKLDNPFSRIAIRSLELDNLFSWIAICSPKLDNPFSQIAIQSERMDCLNRGNEMCNSRERLATLENGLLIRGNQLQFERTDCLIRGNQLQCERTSCPILGNKLLIRENKLRNSIYRKVRCITRDNVQHAPPKVEEKTWKKPQVH